MSTSGNIRLSRSFDSNSHDIEEIEENNNPNINITIEDDDDDDDILITSATTPQLRTTVPTLSLNNRPQSLARRLQTQFLQQEHQNRANNLSFSRPNQRQNNQSHLISVDEMPDMSVMDTVPIIYSVPNSHIHSDEHDRNANVSLNSDVDTNTNTNNHITNTLENEAPILISSDGEDTSAVVEVEEIDNEDLHSVELNEVPMGNDLSDTHSDTATAGSIETSRSRMALSADERSLRNARNAQSEHLRFLRLNRHNRNQQYTSNNTNAVDADADVEIDIIHVNDDGNVVNLANSNDDIQPNTNIIDDNDDVQFVSERQAPDIEILSSNPNPGFQLYTPSGSLFVPVDSPSETRRGGGRYTMGLGSPPRIPPPSALRNFSSFMRPDHDATRNQERLRQRQREANRRARDAAIADSTRRRVGGVTVADRISMRSQRRRSVDTGTTSERNVRPRLTHDQSHNHSSFANSEEFRLIQALSMRANNDLPTFESIAFDAETFIETGFAPYFGNLGSSGVDEIPANIMRILQSRDEQKEEERISSRTKIANAERIKKSKLSKVSEQNKSQYSNDLGGEDRKEVCVLCGVDLVEGIPKQYEEKDGKYEVTKEKDIKQLIDEGFRLPWNLMDRYTPVEIDLSKKVYFCNCGHIYCGRCVRNIISFKSMNAKERRAEKNKIKGELANYDKLTIEELNMRKSSQWAPIKCVGKDCDKAFSGKKPFTAMYL